MEEIIMEMNNITNINNVSRMIKKSYFRGEIYYADFGVGVGSEQGGIRPVIIAQNDVGNTYSPTVIVFAITSQINKAKLPIHVEAYSECGLALPSVILCEQVRTFDKRRLREFIGKAPRDIMDKVDKAIQVSLAVGDAKYTTMTRQEQIANIKSKLIVSTDTTLRELIQENVPLKTIEMFTEKRVNRINELKEYCKLNRLDYTRFYSMVATDTRTKQYN
jgi:mRNA interferase MazF